MRKLVSLIFLIGLCGCATKGNYSDGYSLDYLKQQEKFIEKNKDEVSVYSDEPYKDSTAFDVIVFVGDTKVHIWIDRDTYKKKYVSITSKDSYWSDGTNAYIAYDKDGNDVGIAHLDTTDLIEYGMDWYEKHQDGYK